MITCTISDFYKKNIVGHVTKSIIYKSYITLLLTYAYRLCTDINAIKVVLQITKLNNNIKCITESNFCSFYIRVKIN